MIGDIYLFIRQFFKQTFCIHEYTYRRIYDYSYRECNKCGRVK